MKAIQFPCPYTIHKFIYIYSDWNRMNRIICGFPMGEDINNSVKLNISFNLCRLYDSMQNV